jgi:hypothetical protein
MYGRFVLRVYPEVEAGTIADARRNGDTQSSRHEQVSGAAASQAGVRPGFAATATVGARGTQEDHHRHDSASVRLVARQTDFSFDRIAAVRGVLGKE